MARNRASAKKAGTAFETLITQYLAEALDSDYIERRARHGRSDVGDIGGVRTVNGQRVVIEAKDYGGRFNVGPWLQEAETERVNDGAAIGVVIAKRRGTTDPGEQVAFMTVRDLAILLADRSL